MSELRFGDFTGDGVTDVLAVRHGRWVISESARMEWRPLNHDLGDPVADLFIANMDADDNIDDILRLERLVTPLTTAVGSEVGEKIDLIWWRSKNGIDRWREFKRHSISYYFTNGENLSPRFGFVGRFGAVSGGTLVIDHDRLGLFFSPQVLRPHDATEWKSLFPY